MKSGTGIVRIAAKVLLSIMVGIPAAVLPASGSESGGLVVEKLRAGAAAADAGLVEGDILLAWRRADDDGHGMLSLPYDLDLLETEEAPRNAVTLIVCRGGGEVEAVLGDRPWGMTTYPRLEEGVEILYRDALGWNTEGDVDAAVDMMRRAASELAREDPSLGVWALHRAGKWMGEAGRWGEARALYWEAVQLHETLDRLDIPASLHGDISRSFQKQNRLKEAIGPREEALRIERIRNPESLVTAAHLSSLGVLHWYAGDLERAETLFLESLDIRSRSAPGSYAAGGSHNNLGLVAIQRGDFAGAEEHLLAAVGIFSRKVPGQALLATGWNNLGALLKEQGRLEEASDYFGKTLEIYRELDPEGLSIAHTYQNLGNIEMDRGDLAAAEDRYRSALEIRSREAFGSPDHAATLNNLGNVTSSRGDLRTAETYYRKALEIYGDLAPDSVTAASILTNLGDLLAVRGEDEEAMRCYREAVAAYRGNQARSLPLAAALDHIGDLLMAEGDFEGAEARFQEARTIREALAPRGPGAARSLHRLGVLALESEDLAAAAERFDAGLEKCRDIAPEGLLEAALLTQRAEVRARGERLEEAEADLRKALRIRRALAPGSLEEADGNVRLSRILRKTGRDKEARAAAMAALDALETQMERLGGSDETRARCRAGATEMYRWALTLLLEADSLEDAWEVQERWRGRELMAMMAERDLVFREDLPADLDRERRMAALDADRMLAELENMNWADDPLLREEAAARLREARRRQEEIRHRIRETSPRLAAVRYPEPLDLERTRRVLEPGTLVLSYVLRENGGWIFAVGPGSRDFRVVPMEAGRPDLRSSVARLRSLLERKAGAGEGEAFRELLEGLSGDLLRPVSREVAMAERLVVLPDGPLHFLPFCALNDPAGGGSGGEDLKPIVKRIPVSVVSSASLLARFREGNPESPPRRSAVFGDPFTPTAAGRADPREGMLPHARREAKAVAEKLGEGCDLYVGAEATEERAKGLTGRFAVLHFACHGRVDRWAPLESALVLSSPAADDPGGENGLLQSWEIMEELRMEADLCVLSACETALGAEAGGEGLLALTRAFHLAGADSVVASLWRVDDASTASLMERFYDHLLEDLSKDEALRRAQVDLMDGPASGTGVPCGSYSWAAFQLYGSWD